MKEKYTKRELQDAFDAARRINATGNEKGRAYVERKYRNFSEYFEAKYPKISSEPEITAIMNNKTN